MNMSNRNASKWVKPISPFLLWHVVWHQHVTCDTHPQSTKLGSKCFKSQHCVFCTLKHYFKVSEYKYVMSPFTLWQRACTDTVRIMFLQMAQNRNRNCQRCGSSYFFLFFFNQLFLLLIHPVEPLLGSVEFPGASHKDSKTQDRKTCGLTFF